MTILFHFRTQGTGAEGVHIAGIARAFIKADHRVQFSSPTGANPLETAGSNPFSKRRASLLSRLAAKAPGFLFELMELAYNLPALLRNWKLTRQDHPGLIYERHAFFLFSTAILARLLRIPLAVEVNELAGDERVRSTPVFMPLARLADRITFHAAKVICVVSPHLKRRIVEMGVAPEKILVLPNAVSADYLAAPLGREACRAKLGLTDEPVIGFVGWFVPWHRLDLLLEAVARIATSGTPLKLMLVGDGPLGPELQEKARALGISDSVIFTGAVPHESVAAYIDAMDIAVVPHSNEYRSPIKLFEFMARARTTVAPATEPVRLVVNDGENGMLFEPLDSPVLENQLRTLIESPTRREELGTRAKAHIAENFTWNRNAAAVLERVVG